MLNLLLQEISCTMIIMLGSGRHKIFVAYSVITS
jgi:hypothetical protein